MLLYFNKVLLNPHVEYMKNAQIKQYLNIYLITMEDFFKELKINPMKKINNNYIGVVHCVYVILLLLTTVHY